MNDYEMYTRIYLKSFLLLKVFLEIEKPIIYAFTALIKISSLIVKRYKGTK